MYTYYGNICRKCHQPIIIDDIDVSFKGNRNEYLICENCRQYIYVKVRFGRIVKIERKSFEDYNNELEEKIHK